jgi:hypothetical protein
VTYPVPQGKEGEGDSSIVWSEYQRDIAALQFQLSQS